MRTLVPPEDIPLPGTNKDVFIFDRHVVIGAYYDPKLTPPEETMFESGTIFFDFYDASKKFSRVSQDMIDKGKLKIKSKTNDLKHYEQARALDIPTDLVFETDRFERMFAAWSRYLIQTQEIPDTKILPAEERMSKWDEETRTIYRTIIRFSTPYDPLGFMNLISGQAAVHVMLGMLFPGRRDLEKLSDIDKILLNSPLGHFPPIKPGSNYLDQVVFFDPEFPQISASKYINQYGPQVGNQILQKMKQYGKKVLYSDIITGRTGTFGYNIDVDFRKFGLPYYHVTDYDKFRLRDLNAWNSVFPDMGYQETHQGKRYNIRERHLTDSISTQEKRLQTYFSNSRDSLIQLLLLGGPISLGGPLYAIGAERVARAYYPLYFEEVYKNFMKAIAIKIVGLVITAVIAYYTAGSGTAVLAMLASAIVPKLISKINLPFAQAESQMVMNLAFSSALNKFSAEDKDKKAASAMNFLINSLELDLQNIQNQAISFSEFQRALTSYDDVVLPRQQMIIELIGRNKSIRYGEFLDGNMNTGVNAVSIANTEIVKTRPSFTLAQGMRVANKLSKETKLNDILKFGALGLAGFALYKLLKK